MTYSKISVLALFMLPLGYDASAQISNQPFSFRNQGGSPGISLGGREAILNEKIQGVHPDNLLRTPGGELLYVQEGPGSGAFVSYPGVGQTIPNYRGTSFREYHPEMKAGYFNGFFLPSFYGASYPAYSSSSISPSGAMVSTWTGRVTSGGMPLSYMEGNVVDGWTGQVLLMGTAP